MTERIPALLPRRLENGYVDLLRMKAENETPVEELSDDLRSAAERRSAARRAQLSEPGKLNLPPLLDYRRQKYGIIDDAFHYGGQCAYDRLLVWQIPLWEGATFGKTKILMPETTKDAESQTAPRAIIVAAGLMALDHLRSNGMDLGHIVTFANQGHWRLRIGEVGGNYQYLIILSSGDVVSSEDTRRLTDLGFLTPSLRVLEGGAPAHYYAVAKMADDGALMPQRPYKEFDE